MRPLIRLVILLVIPSAPVTAQELRGTLLHADGATRASGVIVTAERDAVLAARAVTDPQGGFLLQLQPGVYRLRALRIGHRPSELGEVTLVAGERRSATYTLTHSPVMLAAVTTTATRTCAVSAKAGADLLTLFDEARKALTLTQLVPEGGRPVAQVVVSTQLFDRDGRPLDEPQRELRAGSSARPFRSIPAGLLAAVGYVTVEQDGSSTWRAPDASVILSPEFAAGHCLRIVDGRGARAHQVGLAFEPIERKRDIVRIAGTLWIDRATAELRELEYRYVGLARELAGVGLGGRVSFTQLADGLWFEDLWEIRMPRLSVHQSPGRAHTPPATSVVVDAIQRTAGEVLSMRRGDRALYTGNLALEDSLSTPGGLDEPGRAAEAPRAGADTIQGVSVCAPDTVGAEPTSRIHGVVYEDASARSPGALVTTEWKEDFAVTGGNAIRWTNRQVTTTASSDGFYSICGAPRRRWITLTPSRGERRGRPAGVRLAETQTRARVDLRFTDRVPPRSIVAGRPGPRVIVTTGDGVAVPYAQVFVEDGDPRVADEQGTVALGQLTLRSVKLRVRRIGFREFAGSVAHDSAGVFGVTLLPAAQPIGAVEISAMRDSPLARAGFYDRIERARRGAFVAQFITPEEIEARNVFQVSRLLDGRGPVSVRRITAGASIALGRGGCIMSVLLDGLRVHPTYLMPQPDGRLAVNIDELVSGHTIAAVEIYASNANAPAELVPLTGEGDCGIVALWTGAR